MITPIEYLEKLLKDFKDNNIEFNKIKTSVGFDPTIVDLKNMSDLPIIIIEDIEYNNDATLVIMNGGKLNFNVLYLDYITNENGYKILEEKFLKKFNLFLLNSNNDITINNIKYNMGEDNIYALTYNLTAYIEF